MRLRALILAAALLIPAGSATAQSISVNYTTTGSSGNWFLDFTVANNIGIADQSLYFFGTYFGAVDITGTPAGWGQWNGGAPWNNAGYGYGGTNINYDNNWIGSGIANGSALNGFIVHTTSVAAPTSVNWYAFEGGSTPYYGNDAHYTGTNPGFEGVATTDVVATPEPASLALLGTGLLGIGLIRRRRLTA